MGIRGFEELISGVSIYTGGASAVYGSDSIAGAINIELADRLDGVYVGGNVRTDQRSAFTNYTSYLSVGKIFKKGRFVLHTEYTTSDEITRSELRQEGNSDRTNLRPLWGGFVGGTSVDLDVHFDGNVNTPIIPGAGDRISFYRLINFSIGYDGSALPNFNGRSELWPFRSYRNIDKNGNVGKDVPRIVAGVRPSDGGYSDNWLDGTANPSISDKKPGKFRAINLGSLGLIGNSECDLDSGCEVRPIIDETQSSPTEHLNLYGNTHYSLTPKIEFIAEIISSLSKSSSVLFPNHTGYGGRPIILSKNIELANLAVAGAGNSDFPEITGLGLNPLFTPALHEQLNQLGETRFEVGNSLPELGLRRLSREKTYIDVSFGFEGRTKLGWFWNFYYDYGSSNYSFTQESELYGEKWRNAIDVVIDSATGQAVCRSAKARAEGYALLDFLNGISPKAAEYIKALSVKTKINSHQDLILSTLSGNTESFFNLPAGPVSFATRFEFRTENIERKVPDFRANGENVSGEVLTNYSVSNSITEGFVEFSIPLLKETCPLLES